MPCVFMIWMDIQKNILIFVVAKDGSAGTVFFFKRNMLLDL